ncbi:MAG: type II toxin-antitoxin system VapC family toxin [Actinomycetota bacterium]|nr:type II toxin-antitoxin system VapC family toxin [Actinomycetota bacterium]
MIADGILDTNTLILSERLSAADLPDYPTITTVTLAELAAGPHTATNPAEKATRLERLQRAEEGFEPLVFGPAAAKAFGAVAASMRRAGRKPAARAFDALIAASAIANNLPLYTCNPSDFQGIDGLTVTAVPHPDQTGL